MKKEELVKDCAKIMGSFKVSNWYQKNLETNSQGETINELVKAVIEKELTIREALSVCLIVGIQWNVKFEGVP
jgi:hypothetical protein